MNIPLFTFSTILAGTGGRAGEIMSGADLVVEVKGMGADNRADRGGRVTEPSDEGRLAVGLSVTAGSRLWVEIKATDAIEDAGGGASNEWPAAVGGSEKPTVEERKILMTAACVTSQNNKTEP